MPAVEPEVKRNIFGKIYTVKLSDQACDACFKTYREMDQPENMFGYYKYSCKARHIVCYMCYWHATMNSLISKCPFCRYEEGRW